MDLTTFAPGDHVSTAFDHDVYLFAGTLDDRAVLVPDLTADLTDGFTGYPVVTGLLTATATATTHRAVVVSTRDLRGLR